MDDPVATPTEASTSGATVARAGGMLVFFLLLSRVLGLLRDTVMGYQFGVNNVTDSYRIAFTIPDTIFYLVAGGGLSSAFVPVFSEFLYTDRKKEAWRFFSVVVSLCSIIILVLILLAWIFAPQIAGFMGAGKPAATIAEAAAMSRILLPMQYAFMIGSVLIGVLYAHKRYLVPGLAPNVYNVGLILGGLLLPKLMGLGIESMAWGALVGAIIGNFVIPAFSVARLPGRTFKPSLDIHTDGVRKFFTLFLPTVLGFSLPSLCALISQKFASGYGEGINTVLFYSTNLMQVPHGIFGQSLALAAFPVLSQFYAQQRMDLYRDQISRTLRTILYLAIPSSVLLAACAPQVVHLIYGYGKAASEPELALVAETLQIFTIGIWAWCLQPMLMRGFYSVHESVKPVVISTVMTVGFTILCATLNHTPLEFRILPWASNVAAIVLTMLLIFSLQKRVGDLNLGAVLRTALQSLLGSALAGGFAYGAFLLIHPGRKILLAGAFLAIFAMAGWIYYAVTRAFKMPETEYVNRALTRLSRKKQ
jgi:putative peptidoglycan lipid II flippase